MTWLRFGHPNLLHLLWGVPLLIALYLFAFRQKRKAYQRFSSPHLFQRLLERTDVPTPIDDVSAVEALRKVQRKRCILMILSYLFLTLALARPQVGTKLETIQHRGLDIMIALDISASMLAEDIKPNRLLKAKSVISSLITQLRGDRIGLIAFAGSSFVQCPLTTDYATFREFLAAVQPTTISHTGTQLRIAIVTAVSSLKTESDDFKVLIILSDGEDHGAGAIEAAESAFKAGIRIYCVGVGSAAEGVPIPLRNPRGNLLGYKKDQDGRLVITRLNETLLREIAQTAGGVYFRATPDGTEVNSLSKDLASLETRAFEEQRFTHYVERFQYFLALALLFLVWEFLSADR
jgi:Ca-activated chloride channel homolog